MKCTIEYSQTRSETISMRLDLSVDDPPLSRSVGHPTMPSRPGVVIRGPWPEAPATRAEAENDR